MNTDCYFTMGRGHTVCEDYAMAPTDTMVVLSDGCSSSEHTDWGARFLCRSMQMCWEHNGEPIERHIAMRADYMRLGSDMPPSCLDATLLVAVVEVNEVKVTAWGDGAIGARRRDTGKWEFITISYRYNAPAYLSYTLDDDRMETFLEGTGAIRTVTTHNDPDENGLYDTHNELREGYPRGGDTWAFDIDTYDIVVLVSDGAESFQRKDGRNVASVPVCEVLNQLLDIKGTEGEFISRAARWFTNKFCPANNWHHHDDLSVAGIFLGEL